ncbi:ATP-binding protein [Breznakiella homolactica]|uniref:histidine kinase n=1 Tax=Breznakiella homolactica TaxID=2798577 RepID=A0A7T7XJZ6_9SPIR|nr:ATP-binding protein [Breznakiella homolactica]QQO07781.1 response regulator [Breznakiella homolactica]
MFKKISLRIKLFILITLVVIVTFSLVSSIVSYRSIVMAKDDAFSLADEMSAKYSYEIKSELQAARVTSESLMTVFKTLIERGEADRDTLNAILQNSLRQKEYIISFCVAFEPNKLDGKDAEYAGQYPLYGESGRYAPYWSLQDGEIGVEPLEDFDNDVWYAGARDSGKEYITDPFFFEVQGTPVLMSSLVFPILIDGEFIGIVSSDMALDSLQEMVSHVNTSGLDEYTEIYSNSGIIVAHPDDEYFNKSVYATSVYNMLKSDLSKAREALAAADNYVKKHSSSDEEYGSAAAFARNLTAYTENPGGVSLDLTLLTNDMAREILQLDADRLRIADQATAAIADGKPFTVTENGYYKVYMPIPFSEATNPWSVAVNVPMAKVLQKSNEIRNYVILVSVIGIAFIALLLYIVTRNLTKPILRLADSAKQVGEGNFSVDIPKAKNNDEVGILSTAFTTMVEQINDLVSRLTKNSQELEKKNEHLGELNVMLAAARDQAEASNRAKSVFLSNMSHEMRTPLNVIVGMAAIGQKAKEEKKKEDSFKKIEEASVHLLSLVNNVLDMSKMEANKLELSPVKFKFNKMLEDAIGLANVQLKEKKQTLNTEIDKNVPETFFGDDFRLSQVIINLLSNAVKFTGEQGIIGLKAFVKNTEKDVCTLQFEVSDTGIGITAEQQTKIFRMFEQADSSTSRSFGGTGLGLALSKRIVGLMGGEIWVESEPDKGSTFFFTVKLERGADSPEQTDAPLAQGVAADTARKAGEGETEPAGSEKVHDFSGKRILLAEDHEINREIVLAMLEATHAGIDCAVNGEEAYKMFAADPGLYDLILMDIQMPVMDGVEATKLIRAVNKDVPIIALTANVFKEDVEKYLESGINGHIGKPLDYGLTMEILEKYLK